MLGIFYTLRLTIFRSFAPAGNSKMFPLARTPPPAGLYRYKATAYTMLLVMVIRWQRGQRRAAKKLWGSPAEQTKGKMLALEV